MNKLIKISEASKKYNISARTLRYYEEVGLLKSIRNKESNYRMYDQYNMKKLEQILLFRNMQFSLQEISVLLTYKDNEKMMKIFLQKLKEINESIEQLTNFKDILNSVIKISKEIGIENINICNLLREQIYINKKNEGMIYMKNSIITVEFGTGIVPMVDPNQNGTVIDRIKSMRSLIENRMSKQIPLIRLKDNEEMKEFQYRIFIKDRVVFDGCLSNIGYGSKEDEIIRDIENVIIKNISEIDESSCED
ncbi:helix-turn-helix domain-containing protein [Clostridium brassicae]|uniref:MerR family transcriptional regulator n=1 Tax=Clostridium brassicae TaxID=2999072 RepID=A0ABT4D9P6_9CLOT|nr:MerR family transcriptional regulator [Clostridium brassicae]MCY6959007.1 MerR family transcriptional regulator [Clostridium brassicae]